MTSLRFATATVVAALVAALVPAMAQAQSASAARTSVSLSAGAFQYDLSGTGTVPMLAARVERPLSTHVLAEGGLTVARPQLQFGGNSTFLAPEVQLQAQLPLRAGRVAPYVGAGVGAAFDRHTGTIDNTRSDLTVSGATGVRAWITEQVGLRAELRVRGIGSEFTGSAAEWTIGTSWRL